MFPGGVGRSTQYGTTTILAELNVWQHFETGLEAVQSNPQMNIVLYTRLTPEYNYQLVLASKLNPIHTGVRILSIK